jgi:hypothetical protein
MYFNSVFQQQVLWFKYVIIVLYSLSAVSAVACNLNRIMVWKDNSYTKTQRGEMKDRFKIQT